MKLMPPPNMDGSLSTKPQLGDTHPLNIFVDLTLEPKSPEWLIDHVIQAGVVTLAGTRAVGKTTSVLPIAAAVAHLCPHDYELRPTLRRHVIWITEDPGQTERVLTALVRFAGWADVETVKEWFHVIEAKRLPIEKIGEVSPAFAQKFTVTHESTRGSISVRPLVVFDTANACFELQSESDNSEVGKVMGGLKSAFAGFPVLIILHLPKNLNQRDDADTLTARGASAWESDAHQCLYLVKARGAAGEERRSLLLGKRRFETDVASLSFESHVHTIVVPTFTGEEELKLRYSLATRVGFAEAQQQRSEQNQALLNERKQKALALVDKSCLQGPQINKSQLRKLLGGNARASGELIQVLLSEGALVEVPIPIQLRTNSAKSSFLITLTEEERKSYRSTGVLPPDKTRLFGSMGNDGQN